MNRWSSCGRRGRAAKPVVLVDDGENATVFEHSFHFVEAVFDVGPEIDGLEGGNHVEGVLPEGELGHRPFHYLAAAFPDGLCVDHHFAQKACRFAGVVEKLAKKSHNKCYLYLRLQKYLFLHF